MKLPSLHILNLKPYKSHIIPRQNIVQSVSSTYYLSRNSYSLSINMGDQVRLNVKIVIAQ